MSGSAGMYKVQDHRVIQFGKNLRKFVRRWFLFKTLQILILLGQVPEQICQCTQRQVQLKDENQHTQVATQYVERKNKSESGQILEEAQRS